MNEADHSSSTKAAIERYLDAWIAKDGVALAAVLDLAVEWVTPPSAGLGPLRGRDDVVKALIGGASGLIDVATLRREVEHIVADGDQGAVAMSMRAMTTQGTEYANNYVWWFTCRDGLIVRLVEHTDTLTAARIFGWVTDAIAR